MEQPTADYKEGCMAAPSHSCLASLFRLRRTMCTCIVLLIVSLGPSSPRLWLQLQLAAAGAPSPQAAPPVHSRPAAPAADGSSASVA